MIGKDRLYKSGAGWCVWRWTFVDSGYITRLHILKTPWFAVCLHYLNKPDPEPFLHDHPVSFLSIILTGGYWERRFNFKHGHHVVMHRWYNWVSATDRDQHTIIDVLPNTVTLAFMGPKTREWGFHRPEGWIHWKEYYTAQRREQKVKEEKV